MQVIHTPDAPAAIGPYSQAVLVKGIKSQGLLFCSGQIAIDPATGEMAGDSVTEQTRQAAKNLQAVLAAAGKDFSNVVKTTCFLRHMGDFAEFNAEYEKWFVSRPARSCVAAAALPRDALVEIELVAE